MYSGAMGRPLESGDTNLSLRLVPHSCSAESAPRHFWEHLTAELQLLFLGCPLPAPSISLYVEDI